MKAQEKGKLDPGRVKPPRSPQTVRPEPERCVAADRVVQAAACRGGGLNSHVLQLLASANRAQATRMVLNLQGQYGNRHVQRVMRLGEASLGPALHRRHQAVPVVESASLKAVAGQVVFRQAKPKAVPVRTWKKSLSEVGGEVLKDWDESQIPESLCYMETVKMLEEIYKTFLAQKSAKKTAGDLTADKIRKVLTYARKFVVWARAAGARKAAKKAIKKAAEAIKKAADRKKKTAARREMGAARRRLRAARAAERAAMSPRKAAARVAFPGMSAKAADKAAKKLYAQMASFNIHVTSKPLRGAGVGGAIVAMGGGSLVYHDEILAGKLKPGAPIQIWYGQDMKIGKTETRYSGKQIYHLMLAGKIKGGADGHSIIFVRYKRRGASPVGMYYREQNYRSLKSFDFASPGSWPLKHGYMVGTNISAGPEAKLSAEYLLKDTPFTVGRGLRWLKKQALRHRLDPGRLAVKLFAGLSASNHPRKGTLLKAVSHMGIATDFNHDMVRLIGLWQLAAGLRSRSVDGVFGNGSCRKLTRKPLSRATSIKRSSGGRATKGLEAKDIAAAISADAEAETLDFFLLGKKPRTDEDRRKVKSFPLNSWVTSKLKAFIASQGHLSEAIRTTAEALVASDLSNRAHVRNLCFLVLVAQMALLARGVRTADPSGYLWKKGEKPRPEKLGVTGALDYAVASRVRILKPGNSILDG